MLTNASLPCRLTAAVIHVVVYFLPSSKIFLLTVPRQYFFCGSFVLFMSCVCNAFTSVHCCLVVTCWERADLLALVCDVYCVLILSHVVSWVRCGTWLYRFLIFAVFLTLFYAVILLDSSSWLYVYIYKGKSQNWSLQVQFGNCSMYWIGYFLELLPFDEVFNLQCLEIL